MTATARVRALLLLPLVLTGCGGSWTAEDLAGPVARTFAHLYVRGEAETGRTDLAVDELAARATCVRGGQDTLDLGPGDDWRCLVAVDDPALGPREVLYEVTLTPEGCFRAEGPPAVVGEQRRTGADGTRRLNPVYAFDGCL